MLVLCDMEGVTRRDVAAQLNVPEGTVASRLARAREALAARLTRRGVALSAGAVAAALAPEARAVSPELLASTTRAATAFGAGRPVAASANAVAVANAVLGGVGARLKLLGAVLVVAAVAVTGWAAVASSRSEPPAADPPVAAVPPPPTPPVPPAPPPPEPPAVAPATAPAPSVALREKVAGRWRVDSGTQDGRALTDWEREGFLLGFDRSGVLTVHRGQIRGGRAFTWAVDATASPALVLTPPDGQSDGAVRVAFEAAGDKLNLTWSDAGSRGRFPGRGPVDVPSRGGAVETRLTLSRVDPPAVAVAGPSVAAPTPNAAGAGLAGTWEADDQLNQRLGRPPGGAKAVLAFTSDPAVAAEVPVAYREMLAGKKVYLAGRMAVSGKAGDPAMSYRFVLVEHLGNPLLVYFLPHKGDEWSCEEAATLTLVPGSDPTRDLLFLTPFEGARSAPVGGFRRVPGLR